MDLFKIAKKLNGLQTVSTISKTLDVSRKTAINYAWSLRKAGYLTSSYGAKKIRLYRVDPFKRKKQRYSLYELINENSKVKIFVKEDYIIHSNRKPSIEETLVRAIATEEFRVILSSLGLFNKIKNWSKLRYYAEKYSVGRKAGALYDLSRKFIRTRKIDQRTRKSLLKSKGNKYIIKNFKSKDFKNIEKTWNVFIPFNEKDLEAYKE